MRAADDVFVALAQVLAPDPPPEPADVVAPEVPLVPVPVVVDLRDDVAREVRVFRARLADAFEAARASLLRELAYAVLGRELVLAPLDLAAIAARILDGNAQAEPVRLCVAPADLLALAHVAGLPPLHPDPELAPGDAVVEFADGAIDARLGVRLAAVLENAP